MLSKNNSQKKIPIKKILFEEKKISFDAISKVLEEASDVQRIDHVEWQNFPYKPKASFRIAYHKDQIFLKFYIEENFLIAKRTEINSETYKDSCLEFFVDFLGDGNYYNLEINAIGTVHLAYGKNRFERSFIPSSLIKEKIRTFSSLGYKKIEAQNGLFSWELVVVVFTSAFLYHPYLCLDQLSAKGNFYKCCDDSEEKHYLSFNPVKTKKPDFHQPSFFCDLLFE